MADFPERDWKQMKSLEARALNDACARTLDKVAALIKQRDGRNQEIYLALWKLLREEDDMIVFMFDDLRRRTAFSKLAAWRRHGLVSQIELAQFTEETQKGVKALIEFDDKYRR